MLWTSFKSALGTADRSIVAIGIRIETKNVPGAEGYVNPRREVDAFMGIALGGDDTWEESVAVDFQCVGTHAEVSAGSQETGPPMK
jgi:hypothetical protein